MNEFMTGSISSNPIKSPLSLAVFEDTGWYKINYDGAQVLDWGNGLGCSFAEERCSQWPQAATDRGYDPRDQRVCTFIKYFSLYSVNVQCEGFAILTTKERAHHCIMT
jgi:hypothetical protein